MENSKQSQPRAGHHETSLDPQTILEIRTRAKWESARLSSIDQIGANRELLSEYDEFVEGQIAHVRRTYQKRRASAELNSSSVQWDQITKKDTVSLTNLLDNDPNESTMHRFLEENPNIPRTDLGGGHGRYFLSKKRLGAELIPDFMIAEENSMGVYWYAVELESPTVKPHRKDGLQTQELTHALGQIRDWRRWLENNLDYARRSPKQDGLGLIGITAKVTGLIIIGRRYDYHKRYNEFRREMIDDNRIVIHSYDWLVDLAYRNRSGLLSMELL